MKLEIRQFPDEVLLQRAYRIDLFDDDLSKLAHAMADMMRISNGVGLAANQVGALQRLIVIDPNQSGEPLFLVNPRFIRKSDELAVGLEGCLSIPGVTAWITRHRSVDVEFEDILGQTSRITFGEFPARIVQHEVDHLNGTLMLDTSDRKPLIRGRLRSQG